MKKPEESCWLILWYCNFVRSCKSVVTFVFACQLTLLFGLCVILLFCSYVSYVTLYCYNLTKKLTIKLLKKHRLTLNLFRITALELVALKTVIRYANTRSQLQPLVTLMHQDHDEKAIRYSQSLISLFLLIC